MFNLLKQAEFFNIIDNGGDHWLFSLLLEKASTNDLFYDGLLDGYADYYDASLPRPEFSNQGLYLFLKGVLMQEEEIAGEMVSFLDSWKLGFVAGWMLAMGENRHELFFVGRPRAYRNTIGYLRLRSENDGVDVMGRTEFRERHQVQYVLEDDASLYLAEVDSQGVTCTCPCSASEPDCKHVRLVKKVSGWFADRQIVQPDPATV